MKNTTQNKPQTAQSEKWKPVNMDLSGEAGKRVVLAATQRVMQRHAKEIKALADK
ncbi:MAG: hypothetical protein IKZ88_09275 [Neisseriaceae bacterium]|nr:hypothetical protein [Neisseriaceae bacterium]